MITSKRLFFIMIGVIVLIAGIGIAGVVLGTGHLQKQASNLLSLKTENAALQKQQESLAQAKKDVAKYTELEKIAKTIVPQEKDQARTVREIIKIAEESGIKIASITFPSSSLGQAAPKATAPAPSSGSSSSSSSSSAAPTTPAAPAAPTKTQVKTVDGISGLYQMEVNVQTDSNTPVPYSSLLSFLSKLEQNRRTAQVTSLTVQPSSTDRNRVTFNVILNVYIKQ